MFPRKPQNDINGIKLHLVKSYQFHINSSYRSIVGFKSIRKKCFPPQLFHYLWLIILLIFHSTTETVMTWPEAKPTQSEKK